MLRNRLLEFIRRFINTEIPFTNGEPALFNSQENSTGLDSLSHGRSFRIANRPSAGLNRMPNDLMV